MKTPIRYTPRALPSASLCAACTRVAICLGRDTGFDLHTCAAPCTVCGATEMRLPARPFAPNFDAPALARIAARARVNRAVSDAQFRVFLALSGHPCALSHDDARAVLNAARNAAATLAARNAASFLAPSVLATVRAQSAVIVRRSDSISLRRAF